MADTGRAHSCIVALCGLPAAGKSTLCRELEAAAARDSPKLRVVRLSFDEVEDELAAKEARESARGAEYEFDSERWREARAVAFQRLKAVLAEAMGGSASRTPSTLVLIDDNLHYRSMRYQCFQVARDAGAAYLAVYLDCDVELAMERNAQRAGCAQVPAASLRRMAETLQAPGGGATRGNEFGQPVVRLRVESTTGISTNIINGRPLMAVESIGENDSGTDRHGCIITITRSTGTTDLAGGSSSNEQQQSTKPTRRGDESRVTGGSLVVTPISAPELWQTLLAQWGSAPEKLMSEAERRALQEAGRAGNASSQAHAVDLRCRRVIGEVLRGLSSNGTTSGQPSKGSIAAALNASRRALLEACKAAASRGSTGERADGQELGAVEQLEAEFQHLCDSFLIRSMSAADATAAPTSAP